MLFFTSSPGTEDKSDACQKKEEKEKVEIN